MFESYKPSNEKSNDNEKNAVETTSIEGNEYTFQGLMERMKSFGLDYAKMAPLVLSLSACATIERNETEVEQFEGESEYDAIPTEVARELEKNLGFTKEVAELCHLRFDPETVKGDIVNIAQIHRYSQYRYLHQYKENATPEVRKAIDPIVGLLDANQRAIYNIILEMNSSLDSGKKLTIMPEGYAEHDMHFLNSYRERVLKLKEDINSAEIERLPEFWNTLEIKEEVEAHYLLSEIIETIIARIQAEYGAEDMMSNEVQALFMEIVNHPARMNSAERSWHKGGALQTYFDGVTDMYPPETAENMKSIEFLTSSYSDILLEAFFEYQQQRDEEVMSNIEGQQGVLVMGAFHRYPEYIYCLPKLPDGSNANYLDIFQP